MVANDTTTVADKVNDKFEVNILPRYLILTSIAAVTGLSIGLIKGTRKASWQFLAENAHRAPTTIQGWYFYNKTKNYKMILEGIKRGGKDGLRLGAMGFCFAGLEDCMERVGCEKVKEIGAGISSGLLVAMLYRLPVVTMVRSITLGGLIGMSMSGMRYGRDRMKNDVDVSSDSELH